MITTVMYWWKGQICLCSCLLAIFLLYSIIVSFWVCGTVCFNAWLTHPHPTARHHCTKKWTVPFSWRALAGTYPKWEDRHHSQGAGSEEEEECKRRKHSHLPCLVRSFDERWGKTSLDPRIHLNHNRVNPALREGVED